MSKKISDNIISGRVPKTPSANADPGRYTYLNLQNAEPDLGLPAGNAYVLTGNVDGARIWANIADLISEGGGLSGNINVNGGGSFGGNVEANGSGLFGGNVEANGSGLFGGNVEANGSGSFGGNLNVNGSGSFGGNVSANGDGNFGGNINANGDARIGGNISANGDGVFGGNVTANGDGNFGGNINANGDGNFGGNVNANGDGNFGGNVNANGDGNFGGNLNVNGSAFFGNDVIVTGNLTANGLTVNYSGTFGTTLWAGGGIQNTVLGNLQPIPGANVNVANIGGIQYTGNTISSLDTTANIELAPGVAKLVNIQTVGALGLPAGSTGDRSSITTPGAVRYNSDTTVVEYYNGTQWIPVSGLVTEQNIQGNGAASYPLIAETGRNTILSAKCRLYCYYKRNYFCI